MPRWLYFLFFFSVLAVILAFLSVPPLMLFVVAALGIVPLAALIGKAVEDVAEHTGEKVGGLLFATFGNATELIIGILSLTKGLISVVSASIIGSILGNALLVLGVAVCVGGLKHGRLRFEPRPASQYASLLALSIGGLLLPTIAELLATSTRQTQIVEHGILLSDFIAVLLLIGYIASILFSVFRLGDKGGDTEEEEAEELELVLGARSVAAIARLLKYRRHLATSSVPGKTGVLSQIDNTLSAIVTHEVKAHNGPIVTPHGSEQRAVTNEKSSSVPAMDTALAQRVAYQPAEQIAKVEEKEKPPLWRGLVLLTAATVGVAILSEILVGAIEPVTEVLHWNPAFVGLIFIPLIGGLPEYFNTISMALDKRMGMVLAASAGSSIQIALLMAPILVLVSLFTPHRLDLVFSLIELAVLALATFLFSEITRDGELVWLEGLLLILLYAMMGGTVFLFGY
jgi:Ca2+:H+ antiporter